MVFSSVTPFLEHHNWHQQLQQSHHRQGNVGTSENPNFQSSLVPLHGGTYGGGGWGGGEGSIRPGSMVDRARLAKMPMPDPGLNCPRCDSTNTKFCYFNNYNLSQPRHFCKTCRRYWTRGGALRNVPVGGGCRRNKRNNKNSRRSKSPNQKEVKSISGSPSRCSTENISTCTHLSQPSSLQLPFMSSYGGVSSNITSNLGGLHPHNEMGNFKLGTGSWNGHNFSNILSIGSGESWRFPFLAGFEVPNNTNLFHYQSEGTIEAPAAAASSMVENSRTDPPENVEENRGMNLSRQILGIPEDTNQQSWQVGNNWIGFSDVITSSTSTTHFI